MFHINKWFFAFLIIILLAIFVRLAGINTEGLWLDEIMQVNLSMAKSLGEVWKNTPQDKPPIVYFETYFLSKISLSEAVLRLPSIAAGVILVVLVMLLASMIYGENKVIICVSGAIISVSPLCVQLSRELLPYAQGSVFLITTFITALKWLETGNKNWLSFTFITASLSLWFIFQSLALLLSLSLITLLYAFLLRSLPFFTSSHEAAIEKNKLRWQRLYYLMIVLSASVLSTFPMWKRIISNFSGSAPWPAPPLTFATWVFFFEKLSAGFEDSRSNYIWMLFVILAAFETIWLIFHRRTKTYPFMLCLWLLAGLILLYILARLQKHYIASRYLIFFIPLFAILVAGGCERMALYLSKKLEHFIKYNAKYNAIVTKNDSFAPFSRLLKHLVKHKSVAAIIAFLLIMGCIPTLVESYRSRPNFRNLAQSLAQLAKPGDIVLFQHSYEEYCYSYYQNFREKKAPPSTYYQNSTPQDINENLKLQIQNSKRLWIAERIYDTYPIDQHIKEFFWGKEGKLRQYTTIIPYRIELPNDALQKLFLK